MEKFIFCSNQLPILNSISSLRISFFWLRCLSGKLIHLHLLCCHRDYLFKTSACLRGGVFPSADGPKITVRWVSVVEFHDLALGIGKVFGQESTVVEWNYQILGLHQVTVGQKLGVILVTKWFKNWSCQNMSIIKKVVLIWYCSMIFFLERFGLFLTKKIHFESPKLAP